MTKKLDIYEQIMTKALNISAHKRLDLRISLMMTIKIALFYLWYIYLDDESKFTSIAIGINLVTWPLYHFFVVIVELRYIQDENPNFEIRKSIYRCVDQLQNLILLIEFCVLVFDFQYHSTFHIIIVTFLILDFSVFLFTIGFNLILNISKKLKEKKYLDSLPKNSEQLANEISSKIIIEMQQQVISEPQNQAKKQLEDQNNTQIEFEYFHKTASQLQQLNQQELSKQTNSWIDWELMNRGYQKRNIIFKLSANEENKLLFDQQFGSISQNYDPPIFDENQSFQNEESGIDYSTSGIFEISFIIAAIAASIILYQILSYVSTDNESLIWLGYLEIIGNGVIVIGSIYLWCKHSNSSICTALSQSSCIKIISTILQGFICGLTSIFYGVIFGAIFLMLLFLYCIMIFCCHYKYDKKTKTRTWLIDEGALLFWASGLL